MVNIPADLDPQCGASRMKKHVELDEAISSINQVVSRLELLYLEIAGEVSAPEPVNVEAKKSGPSLGNILSNGPDRIRGQCDKLHKLIEQLESELF